MLARFSDFETLAYVKGPGTAAYLQLLVSHACDTPVGKKRALMHRLDKKMFTVIDDNAHEGCGFISKSL